MIPRAILVAPAADPAATGRALGAAVLLNSEAALRAAAPALAKGGDFGAETWIRLDDLDDEETQAEIAALCPSSPHAFLLSRAETAADVQHLGAILAVVEAEAGLADGSTRVVAMAESAASLFELIAIAKASPRLIALGWDGEALARDFGGETPRAPDGRWTDPLQTARTLLLAACADARLPAIDAVFTGADREAFRRETQDARRDGFASKFALSIEQAAIVEEVFAAGR